MEFENIFNISTKAMRINRCHPAIVRDKLWIFQFTIITIFNVFCSGLLVNSMLFHDIGAGKYVEASKNCIMVIVSITVAFKYAILLYHQNAINYLIRTIDKDFELSNSFSDSEKGIVIKYAKKGVEVCKLWLVLASVSSIVFSIKAFLLMGYFHWKGESKLVPMFEMTFPYIIEQHKHELSIYCVLFGMHAIFACYSSSVYLGFDPLVPIFMLHSCGQLEVISQRILKVFSTDANEAQIHENFNKINKKLKDIYEFVDCIKVRFTTLYEFTMKTSTFLLPLSAFQIVECFRNRDMDFEFIPFFVASLVHFYMPCYYSDSLMEMSERLRLAIYFCGWEKRANMRARKIVILMLTRTSRPLVINTVFLPICLDTFAEMCRTAYAIFNIMNAAWT